MNGQVIPLLITALAATATAGTFPFADADLNLAWEESAASFVTPSFQDYVAARNAAFEDSISHLFEAGAPVPDGAEEAAPGGRGETGPNRSFTEIEAGAGNSGRVELSGFQGWEVNFLDAAVSLRESRVRSGDGFFDDDFFRADAEVALSDQAGTTLGFAANYEGNAERARAAEPASVVEPGDNVAHSGGGAAGFRSNLWGKAKLATKISGTFSEGAYPEGHVADQIITADSTYDFFWLGENMSRGHFTLSQENRDVYGEDQGLLFGRLGLENDFPIANRLYLSGGAGSYLLRNAAREFRVYPVGRLQLRLSSSSGYFINYGPRLRVPGFRELFMRRAYIVPTAFQPVEDEYFGVRSGLNYNFRDVGRITVAAYERRYGRTYAVADTRLGGAVYFDPGRVRIRGADLFYRLTLTHVEHYGGVEYREAKLYGARFARFPYLPTFEGTAGLTVRFGGGHSASADLTFLGERYPTPNAAEALGAAWVPGAYVMLRVHPGISVTAAAENLTDELYYDTGGVAAPGRTFRLGMNLIL
jgi:hypothetical protein